MTTAPQAAALFSFLAASRFLHAATSFGLIGLFFVSIVDSSFVPLPIPGVTDVMVVLFAAHHANLFLLIAVSTIGSALGGLFSHMIAQLGGMAFLEQRVPPRILNPVKRWMEKHAILAVALPAVLPPPMPLSPFVLAAGALRMDRKRFMIAFTLSRLARHALAAGLGIYYGRSVIHLWNHITARWGTTFLIVLWSIILVGCAIAFYRLYKTSRRLRNTPPANAEAGKAPFTEQPGRI